MFLAARDCFVGRVRGYGKNRQRMWVTSIPISFRSSAAVVVVGGLNVFIAILIRRECVEDFCGFFRP